MSKASNRIRIVFACTLLVLVSGGLHAQEGLSAPSTDETVTIKAEEAWEDETPDIIQFKGNFQLESREWQVTADQATLYGKLDDPDTVILTGAPAVIQIHSNSEGIIRSVSGEAMRITYERESNLIRMEGQATLSNDDSILRGNEIRYEIDGDQINAGGDEGVRISFDTGDPLEN